MTFSFQDYLITEAIEDNPAQAMAQQSAMDNTSDHTVNLTTEIRKLMRSIVLAEPHTAAWDDPRSFTYLDLIEALEVTEQVIMNELKAHGAHQAPEGEEAEEVDYDRVFDSIGKEIKETIRTVFGVQSGEGDASVLPRFVLQFSLVVDVLMDGLKEAGPEQAAHMIAPIISSAKRTVAQQEQSRGAVTSAENQQLLRKYSIARKQAIGNKKANTLNKQDRQRLKNSINDHLLHR